MQTYFFHTEIMDVAWSDACINRLDDVWMGERCRRPRLVDESRDIFVFLCEFWREDFERDRAVHVQLSCQIDDGHGAAAGFADDLVAVDQCAGGENGIVLLIASHVRNSCSI